MSAEREVFKKLDSVIEETNGLMSLAVREFFQEHPEVERLWWHQTDTGMGPMFVAIKGVFHDKDSIPDHQLSKCLAAMESKFQMLRSLLLMRYPHGEVTLERVDHL